MVRINLMMAERKVISFGHHSCCVPRKKKKRKKKMKMLRSYELSFGILIDGSGDRFKNGNRISGLAV